jgi:hypothetical protein
MLLVDHQSGQGKKGRSGSKNMKRVEKFRVSMTHDYQLPSA